MAAVLGFALTSAAVLGAQSTPEHSSPQLPSNFPSAYVDPDASLRVVEAPALRRTVTAPVGATGLTRTTTEVDTTRGRSYHGSESFTTDFFLTAVASRDGGDDLLVCGLRPTGTAVVERWRFEPAAGRYRVRYAGAVPPLGDPLPHDSPQVSVAGGGSWQAPPSGEISSVEPTRTVLCEAENRAFVSAALDPEGRYALLYDSAARALLQLDLTREAPLQSTVVADVAAVPSLDRIGSMELRRFAREGRKLYLRRRVLGSEPIDLEVYTILSDDDNDGRFDLPALVLTRSEMLASKYSIWSDWTRYWEVE